MSGQSDQERNEIVSALNDLHKLRTTLKKLLNRKDVDKRVAK